MKAGRPPAIPRDLARRLDRLSVAAHRFHRFAHHPLCAEYAGEVLRFGKLRLCRGCAMAALGGAAGLASGGLLPRLPLAWLASTGALGAALTLVLLAGLRRRPASAPPEGSPEAEALTASHHLPPGRGKLGTRLLPSCLAAFGLLQGIRTGGAAGWGLAALVLVLVGLVVLAYRRRGPERRPCATCPERFAVHRCRGVQEILGRERAFRRVAGRLLTGGSGTMS